MSTKPKFKHYATLIDRIKSHLEKKLGKTLTYKEAEHHIFSTLLSQSQRVTPFDVENITTTHTMEHNWTVSGRPYYKVWPEITDMLFRTRFDFGIEMIRNPYPGPICCMFDHPQFCKNLLVFYADGDNLVQPPGIEDHSTLSQWFMVYTDTDGTPVLSSILFDKHSITLEEGIDEWRKNEDPKCTHSRGILTTDEAVERFWRVSFGVIMFAINRHELISPDIQQDVIHVHRRGPKGRRKREEQEKERKLRNCKSWIVGSEIDLPRPTVIVDNPGYQHLPGEELQFGHIRSGHMRMQPCGKNNQDRKLIFIAPTVVRPDLPTRQSHGYRIQDSVVKA